MRINLYAQNQHTVVIAGLLISGFAEGDWLEVEADGNAAVRSKGGDGPSINISTQQGGRISISLLPNSNWLGALYEIRDLQKTRPSKFAISLMTGTEEIITASGCAFAKLPAFTSGGEKMTPRKFDFECEKIDLDYASVESILGSVAGGLL